MTAENDDRRVFETPVITDLGTLRDLTAMMADGERTDASFPENTPRGDLTFS